MAAKRSKKGSVFLVILVILVICVTCCPMGQRVTLRTREGKTVYATRVPRDEMVWILYTHSVNKGLVEDGFALNEGQLSLVCTRFRQYGAGMPEPEPGQTFTVHDDYFEISGFDLMLDTQWTRVGRVADHRLRIGEDGEPIHYNQLAPPGTALGLSADSWTLLKEIQWRCRPIE